MQRRNGVFFVLFFLFISTGTADAKVLSEGVVYLKNVKGSLRDFSPSSLSLSVVNENPEATPIEKRVKLTKDFFIIIPTANKPVIEDGSAVFALYDSNRKVEEVKWGDRRSYKIPPIGEVVQYKSYGVFRSWRLARLEVMVSSPLPSSKTKMLRLLRLNFRVSFSGSRTTRKDASMPDDPLAEDVLNALILNPECMAPYRIKKSPPASELALYKSFVGRVNDALTSGPAVKMIVYHSGLYGVSSAELKKAGVPVEEISPQRMTLFHHNRQIPIYIERENAYTFGQSNEFYFYAPPFGASKPYETYWLLYEKNPGSRQPQRIHYPDIRKPREIKPENAVFTARTTEHFFQKHKYWYKFPLPLKNGDWYWDEVKRGEFRFYPAELTGIIQKAPDFEITVYLAGQKRLLDNYCEVYFNNTRVDSFQWRGLQNYTLRKKLPARLLKEGDNELALYVPPRGKNTQSEHIYFIGFEITYTRELCNDHAPLEFTIEKPSKPGWYNIYFPQTEKQSFFLLDVTKPLKPLLLRVSSRIVSARNAMYYFSTANLNRTRRFILGSREKAEAVGAIKPVTHLSLFDSEEVDSDFIIVSHERFLGALKPYLEYRRQTGYCPMLVNVDDIYDCFSYGEKDYKAIKRFFKYRYYYGAEPRLRYVLLVGETSDYVGDPTHVPPGAQQDLVPTYGYGTPPHRVHADSQYTTICGDDDLPDFGIGRFPVNTVEEVATMIKKARTYEGHPPIGDWRNRHVFLTDDEFEFSRIANSIIANFFPTSADVLRIFQRNFSYSDLILIWQRKTSLEARKTLIKNINDGILTLNFFGHGGPNLWTSERLFHINDIPLLVNCDKTFFLTASTCDTCWLDYPTPPVRRSLGEKFVLSPNGGAIGIYGPTTGASPSDHHILIGAFYKGIFDAGLRNFSEAIIYSKILFRYERNNRHLLDQFMLLGDPALSLPLPREKSHLITESRYINQKLGGRVIIKGRTWLQPFWGLARVTIQSPNPDENPLNFTTYVYNGAFQVEYDLPPDAEIGRYGVSSYAYNKYFGAEEVGQATFDVIQPSLKLTLDIQTPPGGRILENEKVNVRATVANLSHVPLEDISVRLRQGGIREPIMDRQIALPPMKDVGFTFSWLAEMGVHQLTLEAAMPGETGKQVTRVERFIPVYSKTAFNRVAVCPDEIRTDPALLVDGVKPQFTVPLYNVGTKAFYELRLRLFVGGSLIGKAKSIKYLKNGQHVDVKYTSKAAFPFGTIPVEVKIDAYNQKTERFDQIFRTLKVFKVEKPMDLIIAKATGIMERLEQDLFLDQRKGIK